MLFCVNSCCETKVKTVVDYRLVTPPDSLLEPCKEVSMNIKTNGDMLMTLIEFQTQYLLCSAKIDSLRNFYFSVNVKDIEKE